jgi:hypothetical protein
MGLMANLRGMRTVLCFCHIAGTWYVSDDVRSLYRSDQLTTTHTDHDENHHHHHHDNIITINVLAIECRSWAV